MSAPAPRFCVLIWSERERDESEVDDAVVEVQGEKAGQASSDEENEGRGDECVEADVTVPMSRPLPLSSR
jgi:hypothetical protein